MADILESPEVGPRHLIAVGLDVRGEAAGRGSTGGIDVEGDAPGWLGREQRRVWAEDVNRMPAGIPPSPGELLGAVYQDLQHPDRPLGDQPCQERRVAGPGAGSSMGPLPSCHTPMVSLIARMRF